VPPIFVTAPHPATALGRHDGQGEQHWHARKLATSSV